MVAALASHRPVADDAHHRRATRGRALLQPPHRVVLAWQITSEWRFEPELARSSEVEVRFTPEADGMTRVDLEHRHLERHGPGADKMRAGVDAPGGWGTLLEGFAAEADR